MRFLRYGWRDSGSAFCVHDALQHRINSATSRLDRHGLNISNAVESVFFVCQLVRNADLVRLAFPNVKSIWSSTVSVWRTLRRALHASTCLITMSLWQRLMYVRLKPSLLAKNAFKGIRHRMFRDPRLPLRRQVKGEYDHWHRAYSLASASPC